MCDNCDAYNNTGAAAQDEPLFIRSRAIIGTSGIERLRKLRVAVFGIGGVGGYTVETLARAGVGTLYLIDGDTIDDSNLNRQIYALCSTIGQYKTAAAAVRISDINPFCKVHQVARHILPDQDGTLSYLPFFSNVDCMVDAVDTIALKVALAAEAESRGIPIVSAMGCGNKLRADLFQFADIYSTSGQGKCLRYFGAIVLHQAVKARRKALWRLFFQHGNFDTPIPCHICFRRIRCDRFFRAEPARKDMVLFSHAEFYQIIRNRCCPLLG